MPLEFTKGSITLDFAEKVDVAGIGFTNYHHYEDLAGGATYTPPAHSEGTLIGEGGLHNSRINIEFFDGGGWVTGYGSGHYSNVFQDTDQNVRVKNGAASALKMNLSGVTWSGYSADYHYYEDLAALATYTPPAKAIASLYLENGLLISGFIVLELYDG